MISNREKEHYKKYVYEKVKKYIHIKKWDIKLKDVDLWLANFSNDEGKYLAHRLLDKFIYYTADQIKFLYSNLFRKFYRDLFSKYFCNMGIIISETDLNMLIGQVSDKTIYSYVTGERNKATDSGIQMTKYYRKIGINDSSIFHPYEVLNLLVKEDKEYNYVIFIDDLIGSGVQVSHFWFKGQFEKYSGKAYVNVFGDSFSEIVDEFPSVKFYYLVLASTSEGLNYANNNAKGLNIIYGEVFGSEYNVFDPRSIYWSEDEERNYYENYYNTLCDNLGIELKRGFGGKGLAIAFSHNTPDNTLPIFWHNKNGWNPLVRRDT